MPRIFILLALIALAAWLLWFGLSRDAVIDQYPDAGAPLADQPANLESSEVAPGEASFDADEADVDILTEGEDESDLPPDVTMEEDPALDTEPEDETRR